MTINNLPLQQSTKVLKEKYQKTVIYQTQDDSMRKIGNTDFSTKKPTN